VVVAEGYLWEAERRGFAQYGAFIPEVVLEKPDLVRSMHEEFVHAGSDVVEAFTVSYYLLLHVPKSRKNVVVYKKRLMYYLSLATSNNISFLLAIKGIESK